MKRMRIDYNSMKTDEFKNKYYGHHKISTNGDEFKIITDYILLDNCYNKTSSASIKTLIMKYFT